MGTIHQLSNDLANQIAAGEVVERPASVVKELVENALDAGATRIRVEIDAGGLGRIRVTDDGVGMDAEDARLSMNRHATSKIATLEDLTRIASFGFRGEALPSIGSVSRLTMTTRARGADEGTEIAVDGGGEPRAKPAGCGVGTTVEVAELFFNVPARRKFLKATATESAHVGEVVLLAALARPDVSFTLVRDAKVAREYLRVASRKERALSAIGEDRLEPCVGERGPMQLEAYLSPPERARAGAVALYLFVNGRPVKDRQLARAVAHAYASVLEPGRYPVGVVYLTLPLELVDVNVHPQKAEVRFADGRAVFDAVSRELHLALAKAFAIPALSHRPTGAQWPLRAQGATGVGSGIGTGDGSGSSNAGSGTANTSGGDGWGLAYALPSPMPGSVADSAAPELFSGAGFYARLRYLAQVRAMFLVCEGEDGLYVLDQHAAAERVTFERLRAAFHARTIVAQRLLLPEVIEVGPTELAALEEHADDALRLGLEVRAVGASAVAVHSIPRLLTRASPEKLVRDLTAELTRAAKRPFGDAADLVLATMACHGSVRAGDKLADDEAIALLRALDTIDFAGHCPHGRPVVMRLGFDELERRVGR
jgi:DNA mismatch repair protein MutL